MTGIPLYQVDAFTGTVFAGNPAAVCPLDAWLDERVMQDIAAENNLAETAFFVANDAGDGYALRWFTPVTEVDLCGHATLASAFILFTRLTPGAERVAFDTRSGRLTVTRQDDLLALDLPSIPAAPCPAPAALIDGLGAAPAETLQAGNGNFLAVFGAERDVASLDPDMTALMRLHPGGVIATAPGDDAEVDFVSRFFAPSHGIPEDPVTGSAHCTLTPYWAARLGRKTLSARQISRRGGTLQCEDRGERVAIAGRAALYLEGRITF